MASLVSGAVMYFNMMLLVSEVVAHLSQTVPSNAGFQGTVQVQECGQSAFHKQHR